MANKILPVADALKQLYQSLGGDDPEVLDMSTNTELIQEIAKVAEGGGGGLPEVTEADDGRVLGVDDGEWKAVEPSGGLVGYLQYSENDIPYLECSYNDLLADIAAGKLPYIYTSDFEENINYGSLVSITELSGISVYFIGLNGVPELYVADNPDDPLHVFYD